MAAQVNEDIDAIVADALGQRLIVHMLDRQPLLHRRLDAHGQVVAHLAGAVGEQLEPMAWQVFQHAHDHIAHRMLAQAVGHQADAQAAVRRAVTRLGAKRYVFGAEARLPFLAHREDEVAAALGVVVQRRQAVGVRQRILALGQRHGLLVVGVSRGQLADVLIQIGGVVPVAVVPRFTLDQLVEHRDGFVVPLQAIEDQAFARQHAAVMGPQRQRALDARQGLGELAFLEMQRGQAVMAGGEIRIDQQRPVDKFQGAIRLAKLLRSLGHQFHGLGLVGRQAQGLLEAGQGLLGMTVQLRVAQVFPYARVVGPLLAEPSRLGQCWRSGVCVRAGARGSGHSGGAL